MAGHQIKLKIPNPIEMVGNADVVFHVIADDTSLGVVRLSRGAIDWTKAGGKRKRLTWEQFFALKGREVTQKPIPSRKKTRG